jgi:hypothetical protein
MLRRRIDASFVLALKINNQKGRVRAALASNGAALFTSDRSSDKDEGSPRSLFSTPSSLFELLHCG